MTPRNFPAVDQRVETGPIQFGDDWPGVFIRGDEALFMAGYCRRAMALTTPQQELLKKMLLNLSETLQSCSVGDTGWPPTFTTGSQHD